MVRFHVVFVLPHFVFPFVFVGHSEDTSEPIPPSFVYDDADVLMFCCLVESGVGDVLMFCCLVESGVGDVLMFCC